MRIGGLQKMTLIDYPGKMACIFFTVGCNFRCPYCHNPELVDETVAREIPVEEAYAFLDARKGLLDGVVVTGGEPTMHRDLLWFLNGIKRRGFSVKLDTNGTNPDMLRRVLTLGLVDYVAMDVKAPLERYEHTVARPVDSAALNESIQIILSGIVPYEFRTTIVKSLLTPEDIELIAKTIQGAEQYFLQKFIPMKIFNPQFLRKTTYSDEEFLALQSIASTYVKKCSIR
jgi:pyruvate formate lyase activating enzyme